MTTPLIAPDQTWAIWAVLLAAAAFGYWAETTSWGRKLSGAILTMGFTFALSNLGVIPAANVPVYGTVWGYLVPLAIPLLLFRADLRRILREAGPTLIAFAIGAIGTVVGTIIAYRIIPLGDDGWKLAAIFSATYVGGSTRTPPGTTMSPPTPASRSTAVWRRVLPWPSASARWVS